MATAPNAALSTSTVAPEMGAPSAELLNHLSAAYGSWAARSASAAHYALNRGEQADGEDVERAWRTFAGLLAEAFPGVPFDERAARFQEAADAIFGVDSGARRIDRPTVTAGPELGAARCSGCGALLEWHPDAEPLTAIAFCCDRTYYARALAVSIDVERDGEGD